MGEPVPRAVRAGPCRARAASGGRSTRRRHSQACSPARHGPAAVEDETVIARSRWRRPRRPCGTPVRRTASRCSVARRASHRHRSTDTGRHGGYEALAAGDRARSRRDDPAGRRREAARPRRRGVPDGGEVEGGRRSAGDPEVRDLQRGRVRAGDLQGPRHHGAETRSRSSRRMTIAGFATGAEQGFLYIRGEYPIATERRRRTPSRRRGGRAARRGRDGRGFALRHRAATRRGRVHLRRGDGAVQLDRGQARRAAEQAPLPRHVRRCSASPPRSTTSRP